MKWKLFFICIVVLGWGLIVELVNSLFEDVICVFIFYYLVVFELGSVYGNCEYWGCFWLECDFNSFEYYYFYNVDFLEIIWVFGDVFVNMNGFYVLIWRLVDVIFLKMWYISKVFWYNYEVLDFLEKVYWDFVFVNYGENVVDVIIDIID